MNTERKNKPTLAFTTEIGTYGSMPIKDPTVQPVTEEFEDLEDTTANKDLKKFLKAQRNKR